MQIMVRIITPILIAIIVGVLFSRIDKSNSEELIKNLTREHVEIHLPKVYFWIGLLVVAVFSTFCFIMFFFPNGTEAWWVWVIFIIFILGGFYIIFESLFFKIDIFKSKDYFVYKDFFVKTQKIYYCDCISYNRNANAFVIKTTRNKISMDIHSVNIEILMAMLSKKNVKEIR